MCAAASAADVPTEVAELQREVELLRGKVEAHPEVKRFAVENLHLSEVWGVQAWRRGHTRLHALAAAYSP
jgi:hypothetical protein